MVKAADILLIEDNAGDQYLIREGFSRVQGEFRLHIVDNGIDASAYLHNPQSPRPHLVLMDLNLAKRDGREVLADIKRSPDLSHIPVIVFTTSNTKVDINDCYRLGANAFLTKPADLSEFMDVIRSISDFWLSKAALPS